MEQVLLSSPDVGALEAEYVARAMAGGWIAPAGPDLEAFEREIAERVGSSHAVGLASGTAALHLALVSWGVGPGDVIPVSTMTFAATVNAICYTGASPYFVDCTEESGNLDPGLLEQALSGLTKRGASVPVVVPVDLLGKCVDYEAIAELAQRYEARLLCDAAESFGAMHQGRAAGSFGDASVVSFNGNKIMTTSGGGMLLTDDKSLALHVRKLSTQAREPVPHYEHTEIGFNYRLSNILAALGRGQLSRLDEMLDRRRLWREQYKSIFADSPGVRILGGIDDEDDNCWLTAVIIDPSVSSWTAADLAAAMTACGVETRPLWKPMHLQPVFSDFPAAINGASESLFRNGLTLPSGSGMTDSQFAVVRPAITKTIGV